MTFFLVKIINNSMWQNYENYGNYVFKNAENWPGFILQTRYLVDILFFLNCVMVYSSWCTLRVTAW